MKLAYAFSFSCSSQSARGSSHSPRSTSMYRRSSRCPASLRISSTSAVVASTFRSLPPRYRRGPPSRPARPGRPPACCPLPRRAQRKPRPRTHRWWPDRRWERRPVRDQQPGDERQRRDDADPLLFQCRRNGAQRRVVASTAQPGEHFQSEPIGADVQEPRFADAAAEHGLLHASLPQHLHDAAELAHFHPGPGVQSVIRLSLVSHRDHAAARALRRFREKERQAPRSGDEPDRRLGHRAMPRSVPSRKATKWSISGWPPNSAVTCATASRRPNLLRNTILYAPFTRVSACSSKCARVRPTVLSPTTSARSPCTVTYGGMSWVTIAPPLMKASRP